MTHPSATQDTPILRGVNWGVEVVEVQIEFTFQPVANFNGFLHTAMMSKVGYDALMHEVCVGLGFCGCIKHDQPLHVDLFIPSHGVVTADQFVEWVFLADDMNPNTEREQWQLHKEAIRTAFVRHMGSEVVDVMQLQWSNLHPQDNKPG